jgi:hypothetical protein
MGVGGQRHTPAALPPGMTRYPLYTRLGSARGGLDGCWKSRPHRDFFCPVFFPFIHFVPSAPSLLLHVTLCSILLSLYNKHNTNIHVPVGIRTHNPSKRSAAGPRIRPRGHWDRQGFNPRTVQLVASRYTDYAIPAYSVQPLGEKKNRWMS